VADEEGRLGGDSHRHLLAAAGLDSTTAAAATPALPASVLALVSHVLEGRRELLEQLVRGDVVATGALTIPGRQSSAGSPRSVGAAAARGPASALSFLSPGILASVDLGPEHEGYLDALLAERRGASVSHGASSAAAAGRPVLAAACVSPAFASAGAVAAATTANLAGSLFSASAERYGSTGLDQASDCAARGHAAPAVTVAAPTDPLAAARVRGALMSARLEQLQAETADLDGSMAEADAALTRAAAQRLGDGWARRMAALHARADGLLTSSDAPSDELMHVLADPGPHDAVQQRDKA
jgi:hypothetical protein